jgi:hypothetical protein
MARKETTMNFKPFALLVVAMLATVAPSQAQSPCSPAQFPLLNAKGEWMGDVQVVLNDNRVCVTYRAHGSIKIGDASLAVAQTRDGIPGMDTGEPYAFGFPWMAGLTLPTTEITGCVLMPENNPSGMIVVSTQANLRKGGIPIETWAGFVDGTNTCYFETTCLPADEP